MTHDGQMGVTIDSDGFKLFGTLFLARDDDPKPTALILHGIPGIEKNYDIALALREVGWNSLMIHYRGSWGSEGDYVLKTIPDDVQAAVDYLSSGLHPQINANKLIVIGHSLGGWVTILSAAADPRLKAAAVYGAVTDPRTLKMSAADAEAEFTPWLAGLSPDGFVEQWEGLDDAFIPVEQVERIAPRPLLIIHGEGDDVVPSEQAWALKDRAGENSELVFHPEANHSFTWHRSWLREQIFLWLDELDW